MNYTQSANLETVCTRLIEKAVYFELVLRAAASRLTTPSSFARQRKFVTGYFVLFSLLCLEFEKQRDIQQYWYTSDLRFSSVFVITQSLCRLAGNVDLHPSLVFDLGYYSDLLRKVHSGLEDKKHTGASGIFLIFGAKAHRPAILCMQICKLTT